MIYSIWYKVLSLLSVGGAEWGGTDCVFGVNDVAGATSFTSYHMLQVTVLRS